MYPLLAVCMIIPIVKKASLGEFMEKLLEKTKHLKDEELKEFLGGGIPLLEKMKRAFLKFELTKIEKKRKITEQILRLFDFEWFKENCSKVRELTIKAAGEWSKKQVEKGWEKSWKSFLNILQQFSALNSLSMNDDN